MINFENKLQGLENRPDYPKEKPWYFRPERDSLVDYNIVSNISLKDHHFDAPEKRPDCKEWKVSKIPIDLILCRKNGQRTSTRISRITISSLTSTLKITTKKLQLTKKFIALRRPKSIGKRTVSTLLTASFTMTKKSKILPRSALKRPKSMVKIRLRSCPYLFKTRVWCTIR